MIREILFGVRLIRLYRKASFSQIRVRSVDHNQPYLGTKIPLSMTILATHTCNLKCIHCSEWQPRKEYLTTERLHILIDELKNEGTVKISLTGGEPLMTKDVDAILDHINNKNFITHLTSNGYLVPKIY